VWGWWKGMVEKLVVPRICYQLEFELEFEFGGGWKVTGFWVN
jgi:hypothetical protein